MEKLECLNKLIIAEREIERLQMALDKQEKLLLLQYDEGLLSSYDIKQAFQRIRHPETEEHVFR